MAGFALNYAIPVGLILSLGLSLIDCKSSCIVGFSGGKMTKYGDCRQTALNNVLENINEMAQKEAASRSKTTKSTTKTTETTKTTKSTIKNPATKTPPQHPPSQDASANAATSAMLTADAVTQTSASTSHSSCSIDVMFVLDGSGSFRSHFPAIKQWVKSVAKNLTVLYPGIQLGVVQYSIVNKSEPIHQQKYIKTEVKLRTQKCDDFSRAVDKIELMGGKTFTAAALRKVRLDFINSENFNMTGNIQVLILITDGVASDSEMLPQSAKDLRDIGVTPIFIVVSAYESSEIRVNVTGNVSYSVRIIWVQDISGLNDTRINWTDYFWNC